ncbi:MAG: hypothetical protein RLZZ245_2114 [Verrucomicrobiota bacterium]|jgi:predicted GH43/DUF377 family glycosyl hydrolase
MSTLQLNASVSTDLAKRFPENPIMHPQDIRPSGPDVMIECLLNPGVFSFEGRTWLLLRVAERPKQTPGKISFPVLEDGKVHVMEFDKSDPRLDDSDPRVISFDGEDYLTTLSHLRLVSSSDGVNFREEPNFQLLTGVGPQEAYGIEDCRVTQIGEEYFLTYTAASSNGVGVGLRSTTDWRSVKNHGMIFTAHNKDCAIFDEKINGIYYALHRPSSKEIGGNYIWTAESPDMLHWGNHRCIARTRPGMWDSQRIGAGAAPIHNSAGWLEIYHGADENNRYCLGALLLDLNEPWKVLARSKKPIMEPLADYEKTGFFGNVVFTNGHIVDGDRITMYYGASDSVICGARFSISEILESLGV